MTDSENTIAALTAELAGARTEAIAYKRERDAIHSLRNGTVDELMRLRASVAALKAAVDAERDACAAIVENTPVDVPPSVVAEAIRGRGTR